MNNTNQPQGPQIDLKNTTAIKTKKGKSIFQQGVILRTVSKFFIDSASMLFFFAIFSKTFGDKEFFSPMIGTV